MDHAKYSPMEDFIYNPSRYSQYSMYKGHNIMLRDDEDLGYLTFGHFFEIEGVSSNLKAGSLPNNIVSIGSVFIPLPKYSYDRKRYKLSELNDYYAGAIKRLVDSYLDKYLKLCIKLGIVKRVMDKRLIEAYKNWDKVNLKTFLDISTITFEERQILRECYDHPWSWQDRFFSTCDYETDLKRLLNINSEAVGRGNTENICYFADPYSHFKFPDVGLDDEDDE